MAKSILNTRISYNEDNNSKTVIKFNNSICKETKLANNNFLYACNVRRTAPTQLFTISFTCNQGFYYSDIPKIRLKTKSKKDYTITESFIKGGNNEIVSKTFIISYKDNNNTINVDNIIFNYSTEKSNTKLPGLDDKLDKITTLYNKISTATNIETQTIQNQIKQLENEAQQNISREIVMQQQVSLEEFVGSVKNVNFIVDNVNPRGENRALSISGTPGTIFSFIITRDNDGYTYDPSSQSFKVGNNRFNNIRISESGIYSDDVVFPSISSNKTYSASLLVINGNDNSGTEFPININQYAEITVTFAVASGSNSSSYNTMPSSVTLTRPTNYLPKSINDNYVSISWEVSLKSSNDSSLTMIRQPIITDFFTTKNINTDDPGDVYASTNAIRLDDVIGLSDGIKVTGSSPFDVSDGTQFITNVNSDTNVIKVTSSQNLNDNQALTFTGYGKSGIQSLSALLQSSNGTAINFQDIACALTETTTTTDASSSSSTTIPLTSTKGIKAAVTNTVDGATTDSTRVTLDSVSNLAEGMALTATSSGSLSDIVTTITNINTTSKTLILSSAETLPDGATLTFNGAKITGPGISGDIWVSSVSAGVSVVATSAQTLENGVTLSFGSFSSKTATITVELDITRLGDKSFTATLELDNFLNVH